VRLQRTSTDTVDLINSPLNLAIVAPSLRILGGQSVQADALLRAWSADEEVRAWLVPHNPVLWAPLQWMTGVKYLRTLATEACYLPLLVRELRKADVVHIFSASYSSFLLAPMPALAIAALLGKPTVLNYHSGEAPDHLRRSAFARWVLARADRLAVPSPFLGQVFDTFGLPATVVPNMIPLERFPFRPRRPLGPRLLSTRNLEPLYNVACTLRAFQQVQRVHRDASLTVVGAGSDATRLSQLASALGLDRVAFAGRVPPDRIAEYYDAHDIYIQSPNIDNMPLSVLEAFASGLPVVSTDAGGVPTILRHGEHGLLTPVDDADALAGSVLRLLANPDEARAMAAAAHRTLEAYAWTTVRERWMTLYRSVRPAALPARTAVQA
jgi:glycosyltransferase involved in cell wall biosynthesis